MDGTYALFLWGWNHTNLSFLGLKSATYINIFFQKQSVTIKAAWNATVVSTHYFETGRTRMKSQIKNTIWIPRVSLNNSPCQILRDSWEVDRYGPTYLRWTFLCNWLTHLSRTCIYVFRFVQWDLFMVFWPYLIWLHKKNRVIYSKSCSLDIIFSG